MSNALKTSRLRQWRARQGLSQREVADLIGKTDAMVCMVENGERDFAPMTKVHVARCLGVRVADLFDVPELEADA
ncbi:MAG: helix-turn-helix transcriptional regulator [Acidimicrobiia bacterium]